MSSSPSVLLNQENNISANFCLSYIQLKPKQITYNNIKNTIREELYIMLYFLVVLMKTNKNLHTFEIPNKDVCFRSPEATAADDNLCSECQVSVSRRVTGGVVWHAATTAASVRVTRGAESSHVHRALHQRSV